MNRKPFKKVYRTLAATSLAFPLMFGCASTSNSSYIPSENQEERVQKLLVGTWEGYVKDTRHARLVNRDRTLEIYGIRKEQNGWVVNANLNWKSPEYIKLYVYNDTVTLEIMDRYDGLYTLTPYQNTHLLGHLGYDRGKWPAVTQNEVVLKKRSR